MIQSWRAQDRIVVEYLSAVAEACASLPTARREELVNDLREHIAVARAALREQSEAGVRQILDRLGDPAAIAAEAVAGEPLLAGPMWTVGNRPAARHTSPVIAVALIGFAAFLIAMVAGLILTTMG